MTKQVQDEKNITAKCVRDEPAIIRKRIGTTTYIVSVRFDDTGAEKLEEKIFRLIEREAKRNA